jgi:hypothetical protein
LQSAVNIGREGRAHRLHTDGSAATYGEWLQVMFEYQLPGLAPRFNNHWWRCGKA